MSAFGLLPSKGNGDRQQYHREQAGAEGVESHPRRLEKDRKHHQTRGPELDLGAGFSLKTRLLDQGKLPEQATIQRFGLDQAAWQKERLRL